MLKAILQCERQVKENCIALNGCFYCICRYHPGFLKETVEWLEFKWTDESRRFTPNEFVVAMRGQLGVDNTLSFTDVVKNCVHLVPKS